MSNFASDNKKFSGLKAEHLRFKDHDKLAHYAKAACDIQYLFPMGWNELNGIHNRSAWDLSRHQEYSKKSLEYLENGLIFFFKSRTDC